MAAVHKVATLAAGAVLAISLAGCGSSAKAPTTTVAEGTRVDAARYLADTAAGAAAVNAFASELTAVSSPATAASLRAVAPRLEPPLRSARIVRQRLAAERLADRRLDEQRGRNATAFGAVVAAMEQMKIAADTGDPAAARAASLALNGSIGALRGPASTAP